MPLILACSSTTPKRLVIPEEIRRPLSTGQTVAEAAATSPDTISVARNRG